MVKVLWKETAFPCCKATDSRWNRKPVSLVSWVTADILQPSSCIRSTARWFHVPAVSTATAVGQLPVFGLLGTCRLVSCMLPCCGCSVCEVWIGIHVGTCIWNCDIPCHRFSSCAKSTTPISPYQVRNKLARSKVRCSVKNRFLERHKN